MELEDIIDHARLEATSEDGIDRTPLNLDGRSDVHVCVTDGGQVARIATRLSSYVMASVFGIVGFSLCFVGFLGFMGFWDAFIQHLCHNRASQSDLIAGKFAGCAIGVMFMVGSVLMTIGSLRNSTFDRRTKKCLLKPSLFSSFLASVFGSGPIRAQEIDFSYIRCLQTLSYRTKPDFNGRYEDLCQLNLVLVDGKRVNLTFCGPWHKEMDEDAQVLANFLGVPIAHGLSKLNASPKP